MNKLVSFFRESSIIRFLIPVGLILIAFGVTMLIININNQNYIKIEATVADVEEEEDIVTDADGNHTTITYNVSLKYTVDGKEYIGKLDNVSKHKIGDKMEIYYNPNDPKQITETKSLILPICIIIAGIIMLTVGVIKIITSFKSVNTIKE